MQIENRQASVEVFLASYFPLPTPRPAGSGGTHQGRPSDRELIDRAKNAKSGARFGRLFGGDWEGNYASQSEADLALCSTMAFWTAKDAARIDSLFRQSGLYRDKWDEKHSGDGQTYGEKTIAKAIQLCRETYEPRVRSGSSKSSSDPKPATEIFVVAGQLPRVVDQAEGALVADKDEAPIYQRGGVLVRVFRIEAETVRHGFKRRAGSIVIRVVELPYLLERLTLAASWYRFDAKVDRWVATDCPERVAKTLAARGTWKLPPLVGTLEAPTLRPDGSILDKPGYDEATGLLFDPGDVVFPLVTPNPTQADALKALQIFVDLLSGFRFVDCPDDGKPGSDFAVAISAILTALIRRSIKSAPLFAYRAPKMGSGKSLLADVVALIATGRPCAVMSLGEDSNEERKRWLSVLLEGDSVVCIDNIERPLGGSALCSILTQETYKDRILGMSRTVSVSTAVTLLCTGNNLIFEGDLTTRVIPCDLDPGVEHPEERRFDVNLYEYVPQHRGELVAAALTILRAYVVAGKPKQNVPTFGRFEEWSDWVRAPLFWLGVADPCAGRKRIEESDPTRQRLGQLLTAWRGALPGRPATVAEAIRLATDGDTTIASGTEGGARAGRLREALVAVGVDRGGAINPRYVGNFLSRHEKRIEGGLKFVKGEARNGAATWEVQKIDARVPGVSGVSADARTRKLDELDSRGKKGSGEGSVEPDGRDPANHGNPVACPSCHGTDFWLSVYGVSHCRRCHPPVVEEA